MLPERCEALGVRGRAIGELQKKGVVEIDGKKIVVDDVSLPKPGQAVAFVMDTRPCAAAVELSRDTDMLICESTYLSSEAQEAHDHGHMTAADAARIAKEAGARRLILTHFSQRYQSTDPFVDEARAIHADALCAKDTKRYEVPKRGEPASIAVDPAVPSPAPEAP